tara:strand:- start:326 stop:565 length:240 start_codon:yes stop_codon:yes gene_type:complete
MKLYKTKIILLRSSIVLLVIYVCISQKFEEYFELTESAINQSIKTNLDLDIFIRFLIILLGAILYKKLQPRIKKDKTIN